jgi:amino acid transporter
MKRFAKMLTLSFVFLLSLPFGAFAQQDTTFQEIIDEGLIQAGISGECKDTGVCTFDDMLQIVVNISTVILGLIGAIMLVIFVMGGVTWLTSGGNQTKIQKGLDTIRDAVIGLMIVLGAYTIVNVTIRVLTQQNTEDVFDGNSTIEDSVGDATGIDFSPNEETE